MSLLRFVARSLFASYFIAEGVKAVTKPAEFVIFRIQQNTGT